MKRSLEDLLAGVPAQDGNGGKLKLPAIPASGTKAAQAVSQLDKTTANARRVLDDDSRARADKTARLKAARESRDVTGTD